MDERHAIRPALLRDDEADLATPAYTVTVLTRGHLTQAPDPFLSPLIPTTEDGARQGRPIGAAARDPDDVAGGEVGYSAEDERRDRKGSVPDPDGTATTV